MSEEKEFENIHIQRGSADIKQVSGKAQQALGALRRLPKKRRVLPKPEDDE